MPHLPNEPIDNLGRRLDPAGIHRDTCVLLIDRCHARGPHSGLKQSAVDGLIRSELIEQKLSESEEKTLEDLNEFDFGDI